MRKGPATSMVVVAAIWAAAPACGDVLTLTDGAVTVPARLRIDLRNPQ